MTISDNISIVNRIGCVAAMNQTTFFEVENQTKRRMTRSEIFLRQMEKLSPWMPWERTIARDYQRDRSGRSLY